jgi:hypothetical protein
VGNGWGRGKRVAAIDEGMVSGIIVLLRFLPVRTHSCPWISHPLSLLVRIDGVKVSLFSLARV